jgi:CO/xanthine dehydrogenase FAD-binding subunit
MSVYLAPESLADALLAVASGARPIAGGTDLVVGARHGKAPLPESLCAIHRVRELAGIRADGHGGIVLGALASHAAIAAHPEIRARFTGLADASAIVGSHATRNTGTIGGNVMNGSPAMDTGAPLICAGAIATLASAQGTRDVAVADLFIGPGRTSAEPDELLLLCPSRVPAPHGDRGRRRRLPAHPERRRDALGRAHRDHRARADDPPDTGRRGPARGLRRC